MATKLAAFLATLRQDVATMDDLVEPAPEEVSCIFCLELVADPVMSRRCRCQQAYCRKCVTKWITTTRDAKCPTCRSRSITEADLQTHRFAQVMLERLHVKCAFGCSWKGKFQERLAHHDSCPIVLLLKQEAEALDLMQRYEQKQARKIELSSRSLASLETLHGYLDRTRRKIAEAKSEARKTPGAQTSKEMPGAAPAAAAAATVPPASAPTTPVQLLNSRAAREQTQEAGAAPAAAAAAATAPPPSAPTTPVQLLNSRAAREQPQEAGAAPAAAAAPATAPPPSAPTTPVQLLNSRAAREDPQEPGPTAFAHETANIFVWTSWCSWASSSSGNPSGIATLGQCGTVAAAAAAAAAVASAVAAAAPAMPAATDTPVSAPTTAGQQQNSNFEGSQEQGASPTAAEMPTATATPALAPRAPDQQPVANAEEASEEPQQQGAQPAPSGTIERPASALLMAKPKSLPRPLSQPPPPPTKLLVPTTSRPVCPAQQVQQRQQIQHTNQMQQLQQMRSMQQMQQTRKTQQTQQAQQQQHTQQQHAQREQQQQWPQQAQQKRGPWPWELNAKPYDELPRRYQYKNKPEFYIHPVTGEKFQHCILDGSDVYMTPGARQLLREAGDDVQRVKKKRVGMRSRAKRARFMESCMEESRMEEEQGTGVNS